jgi:hypothetical protein
MIDVSALVEVSTRSFLRLLVTAEGASMKACGQHLRSGAGNSVHTSPQRAAWLALFLLCADVEPVSALSARVRWWPSPDTGVAGYNVYVRPAGSPYGSPLDARLPPQVNGTMAFDVAGLSDGHTYYFAVSAYTTDQMESALSGELGLGAIDPCAVDSCWSRTGCEFGTLADGTPCSDRELCDVCRGGSCGVVGGLDALLSKLRLAQETGGTRLRASGISSSSAQLTPAASGIGLDVADGNGALFQRLDVPGSALRGTRAGTRFRLAAVPPSAPGLRSLRLRLRNGVIRVSVDSMSTDLTAALSLPQLTWALRLGSDACFQIKVLCTQSTLGLSCS